ncbi:MAG: adenylyltransferase/cytidyltransferase family protein [Candidatus Berkelbacteria bacterium]
MKTDKKIIKYKDLAKLRAKASKEGKTIVFTSGCYDILHLGHVIHFNFCKQQADILVVTVGNDKTIKDLKGPTRPINDENFRSRLLAALELVDYVVISEEFGKMDHVKSIGLLRPDRFVLNATDSAIAEKRVICEKNGVELVLCKRLPPGHKKGGISSSGIEKQLKS